MASGARKFTIAGLGVAVVGVAVAFGAWVLPVDSSSGDQVNIAPSGDANVAPSFGANGCVAIQGSCIVNPGAQPTTDIESELKALPSASEDPQGSGPWMFVVHGTRDLGLYVRDGFRQSDHRLPHDVTITEGTGVYVDCQVDDGFVADPAASPVGRWFKIRYPQVADEGDFWVYAAYTLPVGHNGQVPACAKG